MTANGDLFAGRLHILSIHFSGTGLTVGQLVEIKDINDGIMAEHYIMATSEDADILTGAEKFLSNGVKLVTAATGTLKVVVQLR
jgi:hypothetical protein